MQISSKCLWEEGEHTIPTNIERRNGNSDMNKFQYVVKKMVVLYLSISRGPDTQHGVSIVEDADKELHHTVYISLIWSECLSTSS